MRKCRMANAKLGETLADPERSRNLALGLGALGGPLIALGIALESMPVVVVAMVVLAASAAVWTMRGIREDQVGTD